MAAKLCLNCGGSGKVVLCARDTLDLWGVFVDIPIIAECDNCNGLGYISIRKNK